MLRGGRHSLRRVQRGVVLLTLRGDVELEHVEQLVRFFLTPSEPWASSVPLIEPVGRISARARKARADGGRAQRSMPRGAVARAELSDEVG